MKIAILWTLLAVSSISCLRDVDNEETEPTRLADDPNLDVSASTADIASKSTLNLDEDNTDILPDAHNLKSDLLPYIEERATEIRQQHPRDTHSEERKKKLDSKHEHTINLCQRDYTKPCPLGFRHVETKDGEHTCIPPPSYTGPCMGNNLVYRNMPEEDKVVWSINCLANWPCVMCRRRYSDFCPEKWELDEHDTSGKLQCIPTKDYQGPCTDESISFLTYNIEMQKQWSKRCQAWWPCDEPDMTTGAPDAALPITMAATLYRITH
ncbi:plasmodium falciparum CPW-WPC domain containing protein, putative [Babesia ovis]|uniref:Plasmodium falciparum CPW-WPC domain containing protein, putative n=1 Tax=Babesia ovis TaxID=5869 RepID=A0A9W5WVW5_BABOV|nr:plasmodium falciparum CPW-WPC domain containing protein, putative [Babesia ovis]